MSMCCVHRAIPACKAAAYVALSIESRCELLYVYLMFATGEEHVRLVTMAQLIEGNLMSSIHLHVYLIPEIWYHKWSTSGRVRL